MLCQCDCFRQLLRTVSIKKKTFFSFFSAIIGVFFLGEMNAKFVQISRLNSPDFAAKRRKISQGNLLFTREKR